MAIFLALVFYPVYERVRYRLRDKTRISAGLVVLGVVLGILIPLSLVAAQLIEDSQQLYAQIRDGNIGPAQTWVDAIESRIRTYFPQFSFDFAQYARSTASWIGNKIGGVLFGTLEGIFLTVLIVFLFYYFLYNGNHLVQQITSISPLPNKYNKQILGTIQKTVDSVLKGALVVAFIQGVLVGIGLWIFGVPNPVIWGTVAAVSALVPALGTTVVIVPAIIYLFVSGQQWMAGGLLAWGVIVVGLVDNLFVPFFYGKGIRVHPVWVLLSVLGGLQVFGLLGFIFGPIILSLLLVVIDIGRLFTEDRAGKGMP